MKRFKLTLLIIAMCLLGSKAQAMKVESTTQQWDNKQIVTITLDKNEYLYQHVEENNLSQYYETADKVIIKTNTTDVETISNLAYLVPNDFTILNKFTKATTMDLHSVNYLFSDVSLKGQSLKYVRLRDNIKNIQASWFKDATNFKGAYSYCGTDNNVKIYGAYMKSTASTEMGISDISNTYKELNGIVTDDKDAHKFNPNKGHLYITVKGTINSLDVSTLCGDGLNYSAVDMNLENATFVNASGEKDYNNFVLNKANGNLKSIILPSDMDVIADNCLENCNSLKQVISNLYWRERF